MEHSLNFSNLGHDLYLVWMSLAPLLLVGAFLSSILHIMLPSNFVRSALSGKGGVLRAVLVGVPLPLCSCGVIPTGLGLKRDGASDGATVGFLISTPQTGIDSILVSASLLGLPFAIFKVLAAAITGLVGGSITEYITRGESQPYVSDENEHHHHASQSRWMKALTHFDEVLEPIWGWVIIGVLASVVIQYVMPAESLVYQTGLSMALPYLITLGISLPLYVCATASVPIAAALVAQGFPIGVALIFLMAGPATNVATLGAVYKGLGIKPFSVYLGTLIIGSIGFALTLDLFLGWHAPPTILESAAHQHSFAWWESLLALLTFLIFLRYFMQWLAFLLVKAKANARSKEQMITTHQEIHLGVSGLTCQGCVRRLEGTLLQKDEIAFCEVSSNLDQLTVRGDIHLSQLREMIIETGFEPLDEIKSLR